MLSNFKEFLKLRERQSPLLARQRLRQTYARGTSRHVILPPRSRQGDARLLCGLHHRHVGHSASRVHPCSWQVHGISIGKKIFTSECALGFGCGGIWCFYAARPSVRVRSCRMRFHLIHSSTTEYSRKAYPSTTMIPPCVYNNSTYSSTTADKRAKMPTRRDSTDALSRIERATVDPTENVW